MSSLPAPSGDLLPRAFGNYLLIHRLAHGGMGNVFLAKSGGLAGIEKTCVVKMLRARFSSDPEYVARFVEEARIVVQLTHRNICGVFDVGRVGEIYYLAMELVVGLDLRALTTALAADGTPLTPACALFAMNEVLDALDYAHRHVDPVTGEPLRLVHRDVSPQNVMVNAEGEVKLIDFGLASSGAVAEVSGSASAAPAVMGKLAYMAPEHARGDPVDGRADQFSAAIVLLELLAGARYYGTLEHRDVWSLAGTGSFRSSLLDSVAPPLRAILERALAPDRDRRFATCADFRDALLEHARAQGLHAGSRELRAVAASHVEAKVHEIREHLRQQAGVSAIARPGFAPAGDADIFQFSTTGLQAKTIANDDGAEPTTTLARRAGIQLLPSTISGAAAPARSRTVPAVAAGVALVVVVIAALVLWPREPPASAPVAVAVAARVPVAAPARAPVVAASASPVDSAAAPQVEPSTASPAPATPRAKARPPKPATTPAKAKAKPVTLPDRLAALQGCAARQPCAARLPSQRSTIATMSAPALQAFTAAVDACLAKCP